MTAFSRLLFVFWIGLQLWKFSPVRFPNSQPPTFPDLNVPSDFHLKLRSNNDMGFGKPKMRRLNRWLNEVSSEYFLTLFFLKFKYKSLPKSHQKTFPDLPGCENFISAKVALKHNMGFRKPKWTSEGNFTSSYCFLENQKRGDSPFLSFYYFLNLFIL